MPVSKKNNVLFTLKKGTAAAVTLTDLKNLELSNEPKDGDDVTFPEANAGTGVNWTIKGTARLDFSAGSTWQYLWTNAGSEVSVVANPSALVPSVTAPNFTGTVLIGAKPGWSREAATDNTNEDFEFELTGTSDFTQVTS